VLKDTTSHGLYDRVWLLTPGPLSGAGERQVESNLKDSEVGEVERRTRRSGQEERQRHILSMLRLIRIAVVLAAARPTLLFRP